MRILIISSIPAIPSWGTGMIFYRHFCQKDDFTISVITDDALICKYEVPYSYLLINKGKAWTRISKTRFYQLPHTWDKLVGCMTIPQEVMRHAKEFKPDAVFTMAGSWTWMAILAEKVAHKLDVPLIGCFYDWWYYNVIFHPKAEKLIDTRFRKFYQQCDLAICISEGMQAALGKHRNSVVLYPMGPVLPDNQNNKLPGKANKIFTVTFTGNLGEWYGKMLESLVTAAKGLDIRFKIFGNNPSWTPEFDAYVRSENIYMGHVSYEKLREEVEEVDALLLLMGFDESCALIEKTSFKSKFIDYLSYHKPIMLWGPSYCTAVATAKEFDSAEVCISPAAADFVQTIVRVRDDRNLQRQLVANGMRMYQDRFHPDKIHARLKTSLEALMPV